RDFHVTGVQTCALPIYIHIGGRTALLLTDTAVNSFHAPLKTDVLIIARHLRGLQPGNVLRAFSPDTVVLAARPTPYQLRRWGDKIGRASCRERVEMSVG